MVRSLRIAAAFTTLLTACEPAAAPPTPRRPPSATPTPAPKTPVGLQHQTRRVLGTEVDAEVFIADLRQLRLVALEGRGDGRLGARVDVLRAENDALVAVNGTFFARNGAPLGLLVNDGTELNPLRNADWGVLEVNATGHARLVHTRDYVPSPHAEFAVQCGPRVVIEGTVPRLKPQSADRTALCVRAPTEVALVVTRGPVQADTLGTWLAAPAEQNGLACTDALLLDGGPSTQLSASAGGLQMELPGGWAVPNGVGLQPR